MPRVSVIIPSYNHEKYVAEAIESVLRQTYQDFEIVITDDGSSDGTVNEIRKFKDPRIKLFTFEKNKGAAFASTNCVANSMGEYIAMLSSDDAFLPDKLEKQVRFLDEHPEVWAVFGYAKIIDEDGNDFTEEGHFYTDIFKQPNRSRFEWLNYFFYTGNCLCHPSVLAKREVYTKLGPPDPRYPQLGDFYRWIKVCLKHDIHIIPEEFIKFRVRAGEANASGNRPDVAIRSYFEHIHVLKYFFELEPQDLVKAFPEAKKYEPIEKGLVPFIICMLALEAEERPAHKAFALNNLFEILGRKDIAEKLTRYNFSHRDFIRLTSSTDIYNLKFIYKAQKLSIELSERERQVRDLTDSYSWKITAPLRKALGLLKN